MKRNLSIALLFALVFSSCGSQYNKILKHADTDYRYEAAKAYYADGKFAKCTSILDEIVMVLKGTDRAEESLYMLGMAYYNQHDYITSSFNFTNYYNTYPKGKYAELARFYSGKSYYNDSPEARLDQTTTYKSISELQYFMEYFPLSPKKEEAQKIIFELQDKLVKKDFLAATLYFNLGNYMMANNYKSAIVTAQNILKDYPYTSYREELSILILRSKYEMATISLEETQQERFRDTVDEFYAFQNEFPQSKHIQEASAIFEHAKKRIKEDKI